MTQSNNVGLSSQSYEREMQVQREKIVGNNNGKDSDHEGIESQVLDDGSWAKELGCKPWSFDVEGEEERLFDVGEEVRVGAEMKGFKVEKKFLQLEEKALNEFLCSHPCLGRIHPLWPPKLSPSSSRVKE
ncbi:hypothetical protein KY290_031468 [Solanum tuberosum]|uniref:Uncharacterized protein n=1 Tax=Solanum tuberosum TaxID=4113 RepID=A0ABQ7U9D6_SOLTU|nr:hypothetical protein KY290_031468 [Solanum tuberosum]